MLGKQGTKRHILHLALMLALAGLKKVRAKWVRIRGDFLPSSFFQIPSPAEDMAFMIGKENRVYQRETPLVTLQESLVEHRPP